MIETKDLVVFLIFTEGMYFYFIGIVTAEGIQYQSSRGNGRGGE
jgi:hypothetical protein